MNTLKQQGNKRRIAIVIGVVIVIAAAISGWLTLRQNSLNPTSQDTVIGASVVNVSSSVPGRIQSINVTENGKVQRGEVMFTLDPTILSFAGRAGAGGTADGASRLGYSAPHDDRRTI
ncbi:multidrug resistance protein MdtN [Serratia fonticola]|uniref:Multidrug resistance protein MdtN n=1 Tax=Serratia fonticola TaxID=47917 RepID=A0A4U9VC13_SERFO|nr:multidrug resistance protein MdtN [Serratia fonticola]